MKTPFVPLHSHSVFSFHSGVCTIREFVTQAKALGMNALALTDTNRMSGLIQFYNECHDQGIKPILGVELTEPDKPYEHVVLLAKNADGYGDLCEIITRRHLHAKSFRFEHIFATPWQNLIFITAFPHLLECIATTPNKKWLYGELVNNSTETRNRSRALEKTAATHSVPLVVSNNSFFLFPGDWKVHQILSAIGLNSTLSRLRDEEYASRRAYLRSPSEMYALFPNHKDALVNTTVIADQCTIRFEFGKWILPRIDVPQGYSPESYLAERAWAGLKSRYGGTVHYDKAKQIQKMELDIISRLGFASYFLFVETIRSWANDRFKTAYRKPKDCSILRGSAANSITFYNLGVSDLDPIRYDLYFQRFLNEDRASPPDADLDFGWDERDTVLDYIIERWGCDRVAITCTTNHFRWRAAFRETAKVFGYSEEQITTIFKSPGSKLYDFDDPELRNIADFAKKIRGKPRFLGQHPGGLLITNGPIWRHIACEYSGGTKNRIITQIDMHNGIDELGLIKFDILGNGSLSVFRDTLGQLEAQRLPDPEVENLEKCFHDPEVKKLIKNGLTRGIFYIESPAQIQLNQKVQAETFEEITLTSSLIRPAGTSYTATFIERHRKMKMGTKDWNFIHPSLEPILRESHDVCAYQEHVIRICHDIAGLSYKTADKIRKQMNSYHEGMVEFERWQHTMNTFIEGCIRHKGLSETQARTLWERVQSFSGFSFCKSHSASYAQLSFQCTYLKAHFPAQFLSAVLSNNHGFYTKDMYIDEARRWGLRILSMSINESNIAYYGKHTWIRPGLMDIRSIQRKSMEYITTERTRHGPYRNLIDFIKRVPMGRKQIEHLILVGAFDEFGLTQPESLYLLDGAYGNCSSTPSLFGHDNDYKHNRLHPGLSDYTYAEKCINELYLLGFMVSGNILNILDLHPASKNTVHASRIKSYVGKKIKVFGWPISRRVHPVASSEKPMLFMTIEDTTGCIDIVIWPRLYETMSDEMTDDPGPFEIWGTVREEWGVYSLEARYIKVVQWSPALIDFERASERLQHSIPKEHMYDTHAIVA